MKEKITTLATESINVKSVIRFLFWLVIIGMTFYFIVAHIVGYSTNGIPKHFGPTLMNGKIWFYLHMAGGATAILIGPLQFWKTFRIKYVQLHRTLGKIYIIGSIVSILCLVRIFLFALIFGWSANAPSQITVTTLWSTIAAWWTIKRKNIKAHRQFMARSYLFAFYFVAVRMIDYSWENFLGLSKNDDVYLANSDWAVWVVPFIILEMYQSWWPVAKINYRVKGKAS